MSDSIQRDVNKMIRQGKAVCETCQRPARYMYTQPVGGKVFFRCSRHAKDMSNHVRASEN